MSQGRSRADRTRGSLQIVRIAGGGFIRSDMRLDASMKADDLAAAGLVALTDGFRAGTSLPVVLESYLDGAAATIGRFLERGLS